MLPMAEQVFDHLHLYDMVTLAFTVREMEKNGGTYRKTMVHNNENQ